MTKKRGNFDDIGFVGLGNPKMDTSGEDFKVLQKMIQESAENQTPEFRLELKLNGLKYQMESYVSEEDFLKVKTIGAFLKDHIKVVGVKNKDFAAYLKIEASNLSAILNGKRNITLDLAAKLGRLFKADAELWLSVQNKNDLIVLEKKYKEKYKRISLADLYKKVG